MLQLFDAYAALFQSWSVKRYEREGQTYLLQITAVLQDNSRLEIRDYLFADGSRKYAYHWMRGDGRLQQRWDNAPHWPDIATNPTTHIFPIRKCLNHLQSPISKRSSNSSTAN